MNISIITAFPSLYKEFLSASLIGRARQKMVVDIVVDNLFSFVQPKERIDGPTFGHGAGMVIRPEVIARAIESRERINGPALKIFFSPHGKKLNQRLLKKLTNDIREKNHLLLLPARYEGMDARIEEEYADEVISVGDFVLMGGDIPAMMLIEGMLRFVPGVVGKEESVDRDSFSGSFVDYPEYCAPVVWKNRQVPDVVRSGNHEQMNVWRKNIAVERTVQRHFDWFRTSSSTAAERRLVLECMPPHYVVLMHSNVQIKAQNQEGTTSVTSIDIHDIARSAKTYGLKKFFVVTPLIDQQKIVATLLDFWQNGVGIEYNRSRHEAVRNVILKGSLDEVIELITMTEKEDPILIATSAKTSDHRRPILTYHDQSLVWQWKRPVLIVLGTGQGLSQNLVSRCDYLLHPVEGLSEFNHLSVRSAAAIIFDRWLGLNLKLF
jgi:tRNA (guanine37-N1)-methyltransferase